MTEFYRIKHDDSRKCGDKFEKEQNITFQRNSSGKIQYY